MANENEAVELASLQTVDLAEQYRFVNQKEVIAPDLESSAPPEYGEMIDRLKRGQKWIGPVNAVRGFHFSQKVLTEVITQGGELYFFPQRPTLSQSKQIARLSESASGWNQRRDGLIRDPENYRGVFCYAIIPDEASSGKKVTVEPNADYFGLMGLRVITEDSLKWKVQAKRMV